MSEGLRLLVEKYVLLVCAGGVAALVVVLLWTMYDEWRGDE